MGRDSSVGIATRYGLDGPGIESLWGARFSTPVQTGPGAYPAPCTGSFQGVKRSRSGTDHLPPSKYRGHEKVGLYLYSSFGPSWHRQIKETTKLVCQSGETGSNVVPQNTNTLNYRCLEVLLQITEQKKSI